MKIIGKTQLNANNFTQMSKHLTFDRQQRISLVKQLGGNPVMSYIVNRDDGNGLQIHTVLDSGVVVIGRFSNPKSIITYLIATPERLRYYGITDPILLRKALENQKLGYNQV